MLVLFFGWIGGLVMSFFVMGFAVCMIYQKIKWLLWRKCLLGVGCRRGGFELAEEVMGVGGGYGRGV